MGDVHRPRLHIEFLGFVLCLRVNPFSGYAAARRKHKFIITPFQSPMKVFHIALVEFKIDHVAPSLTIYHVAYSKVGRKKKSPPQNVPRRGLTSYKTIGISLFVSQVDYIFHHLKNPLLQTPATIPQIIPNLNATTILGDETEVIYPNQVNF